MKKRTFKFMLSAIAIALMLVIPLPVMAADVVTFTNFHFTMSPYEDKTLVVSSNVKNNPGSIWYYSVSSLSGVGTIESGKIFFLEPSHSGAGYIAMPASIHSEISMNTPLSSYYFENYPSGIVYTLYAVSNDAYGSSMNTYTSGAWMP